MIVDSPAQAIFISSDTFRRAAFSGNHPLNFVRHSAVVDLARILGWIGADSFRNVGPASVAELSRYHDRAYVRALRKADAIGRVDPQVRARYQIGTFENPLFPGLFERAATTVAGSILAAELALEGHVTFHPSGGTHHGRTDRACGFCYFNDPVFAISTFLNAGLTRVMYVDLDAHHGDGVEEAFFDDDRVQTLSIHEADRWPYSGTASYPKSAAYNFAVPPGFNDTELDYLVQGGVLPLADAFQPEALVLCCGADSLKGDPLSTMQLSNLALWDTVDELIAIGVPTVVVGGGGYNPWTVARYWAGLWGRIAGFEVPRELPESALELLGSMACDLIDDEDVETAWLTTIADTRNPGPVRRGVISQLDGLGLPTETQGKVYGLA
ncbi:MAG: acetoin utilization protein AcuC [Gammaproteobacteria bacterium]|nr:acetoin utilization protein AcuC [Gammaproteobacteria bacterium]NNC77729.1 acetoin utilization protein AcuC [Woeseiaceae bacterium]